MPQISIKIGSSLRRISSEIGTGLISAVMPSISAILVMFEPTALPNARPGLFWKAASVEISISGAELPKPIITNPINSGGKPRCAAVAAAPSMNQSALNTSNIKPVVNTARASAISRCDRIYESVSILCMGFKWNDWDLSHLCKILTNQVLPS